MAELEFPKILVPRLPVNSSNANTECVVENVVENQNNCILYVPSFLER